MLTADALTLWRGYRCLFEDLALAVAPGEGLLVTGPNGAGKTTLLRVLAGLTRPEAGRVCWDGAPVEQVRGEYGRAMAWCGHLTGLKADLAVAENLAFAARQLGLEAAPAAPPELALDELLELPVRQLSAGQQRRVALARLLQSGARLWLLDEPFANLDRAGRAFMEARLAAHLAAGGLAVLAVHHDLPANPALRQLALAGDR